MCSTKVRPRYTSRRLPSMSTPPPHPTPMSSNTTSNNRILHLHRITSNTNLATLQHLRRTNSPIRLPLHLITKVIHQPLHLSIKNRPTRLRLLLIIKNRLTLQRLHLSTRNKHIHQPLPLISNTPLPLKRTNSSILLTLPQHLHTTSTTPRTQAQDIKRF